MGESSNFPKGLSQRVWEMEVPQWALGAKPWLGGLGTNFQRS